MTRRDDPALYRAAERDEGAVTRPLPMATCTRCGWLASVPPLCDRCRAKDEAARDAGGPR